MDKIDPCDVILWLLPHKGEGFDGAAFATAKPENRLRFVAAHDPPKQREIAREERAGTELPAEYGLLESTNCLVFLFSQGARTSVGVVGGCAVNAEFSIQNIPGVSKYHFALTFDDHYLPIIRDLGSTGGTKVTYGGERGERLSNFDWPLVGPSITNGQPPVLNVTDLVQFKVILPDHDYTSPEYIDKVKKFRTGTGDPENLFTSLVIQSSQGTQFPSRQQTPLRGSRPRPILYNKQIGKGSFGVVTYVWNLMTREEYVVKQPLAKLIRTLRFHKTAWAKEADIMRSISHEHIVAFRGASFSPFPRLEFEYIRGGSLDGYSNLSTFENMQVLCQLSSALVYLHNRRPSIVHRDIKPENILVVHRREADGIYVKFADFGLSKAADILKTCCGTLLWAAPEIHAKVADPLGAADDTYSVAVDIWSLGAVVASLECGLPEYREEWAKDAVAWIRVLRDHVNNNYITTGSELLYLIVDSMLVEDPDERSSADYVTTQVARLLQDVDEGSATPRASSSRLGPQSVVESEGVDENDDNGVSDEDEEDSGREWLESPVPETQTLETSEVVLRASMVDGLLWNIQSVEGASFASTDGSKSTEHATIEAAQTKKDPEEDAPSSVAGSHGHDEAEQHGADAIVATSGRSMRKRGLPDRHSLVPLPRSFTYPPSTDQISQASPNPKRSRKEGLKSRGLSEEPGR